MSVYRFREVEMYPVLFRIGDFPITSFGLMMFLSFIGGAWVTGEMSVF